MIYNPIQDIVQMHQSILSHMTKLLTKQVDFETANNPNIENPIGQ